jgi:glycosyltransferase involved in cell wall biosynthesis
MSLKLLLYTFDWFPLVGGIQTVTMALARGLSEEPEHNRGEPIEVTLVTETAANGMDDAGLRFRVVRRPQPLEMLRHIQAADIVHLAGPSLLPLGLSLMLRKPIVVEHDGYQSICPNGLLLFGAKHSLCPGHFMAANYGKCLECNSESLGRYGSFRSLMLMFLRRWMARRASVNVAPSRHIENRIVLPRTQVIFHGVAPAKLRNISANQGADQLCVCYAFVGRLVKEKGGEVLLRAAHQLLKKGFDFRLKMVGDGPERGSLEKLAAELGLRERAEFLGWVPVKSVTNVLAEAAAVVMPSLWEDVAPLVALEQMMQGRLVIASDIGGLGETVKGFGLTFPVGDADALEGCMRRVIEERDSVAQMRNSAQQHAFAAYQEQRMVEEHRVLYRKIAESLPAKRPR